MQLSKNVSLFLMTGLCLFLLGALNASVSNQELNVAIPMQKVDAMQQFGGVLPLDVKWIVLHKREIGLHYNGGLVTICLQEAFVGCNDRQTIKLSDFLVKKYPKLNIQGYTPLFKDSDLQSIIIYYK